MAKLAPRPDSALHGSLPGVLFHGTARADAHGSAGPSVQPPESLRFPMKEPTPPESLRFPMRSDPPDADAERRVWSLPAEAPAEPLPRLVSSGTYDVAIELGGGAMATVYMAVKSGSNGFKKIVALKRIHKHLAGNAVFVDMLVDEARLASRINHPNVCQVLDFGCDDSGYYIALEFLAGQTLQSVFETLAANRELVARPRHQFLAARVVASLAQGLHAAHNLKGDDGLLLDVVHRDVTPHNLFLLYDGVAKVTDFGVARARSRIHQTSDGNLKGKLAYMAPEQISRGQIDRRADVFSLGVVLWELLTGHRLYNYKSEAETLSAVCSGYVLSPSQIQAKISPKLDSIVLRALSTNEADRFQTAREFSAALEGFLAQSGDTVPQVDIVDWLEELFPDAANELEALQRQVVDAPASAVNMESIRMPVARAILGHDKTASVSDDELWPVGSSDPPDDTALSAEDAPLVIAPVYRAAAPLVLSPLSRRPRADPTMATFIVAAIALVLAISGGVLALKRARSAQSLSASEATHAVAPPADAVPLPDAQPAPRAPTTASVASAESGATAISSAAKPKSEPEVGARSAVGAKAAPAVSADVAAVTGSVFISSSGSPAAVLVNGSRVGQTPMLLDLPPGHRSLTLLPSNGGPARDVAVDINAHGTVMLNVEFPTQTPPVTPPTTPVAAPSATPAAPVAPAAAATDVPVEPPVATPPAPAQPG